MYSYKKLRKYNSDCHIFEFNPEEFRFDATIGKHKKLEKLSVIKGEPKQDEYAIAKLNGGFFSMNGSTEFIGSFVDEGKFYQGSQKYYPTLIFWKSNKLTVEHNATQSRHAIFQKEAWWAVGVPWTLVVNGEINFTYSKEVLVNTFGHPYQRHPRTMVGQKSNGTIVWVVVDGRRINSAGVNITESANIMKDLGCTIAVNLDGGGSSEMIVNDAIVNKPSGGTERAIGTAFMAYAKKKVYSTGDKKKAITTATSLNVRAGIGTSAKIVGSLVKGSTIYVLKEQDGWCNIVYGDNTAWVSKAYVKYV